MGILGRILALFRVMLRRRREAREDPNDALDHAYEKMLTGLQEIKRQLADAMAQQKRLERQITTSEGSTRVTLQASLDALLPQVQNLTDYQRELADRIERFRTQKDTVRASTAAADAQVKVVDSLAGLDSEFGRAGEIARRAEEKMLDARYKASAMDRLARDGLLNDPLEEPSSGTGRPASSPITAPARAADKENN